MKKAINVILFFVEERTCNVKKEPDPQRSLLKKSIKFHNSKILCIKRFNENAR